MKSFFVVLGIGFFSSLAAAAPLTKKALFEHYRGIKSLKASVVQIKESPYLIKPMTMNVDLSFSSNRLVWHPVGQPAVEIQFKADGSSEMLSQGKGAPEMPPAAAVKLKQTFATLRDIITMHPNLDKNFELVIKDHDLSIRPKSGKAATEILFQSVDLKFGPDLALQSVLVKTAEDQTTLQFKSLKIEK